MDNESYGQAIYLTWIATTNFLTNQRQNFFANSGQLNIWHCLLPTSQSTASSQKLSWSVTKCVKDIFLCIDDTDYIYVTSKFCQPGREKGNGERLYKIFCCPVFPTEAALHILCTGRYRSLSCSPYNPLYMVIVFIYIKFCEFWCRFIIK